MQKNQNNFSSIKFDFDPRIKDGYYTAAYFEKASKILQKFKPADSCIMQFTFFGDKPIMVCGINETIQLLKFCLTKQEKAENQEKPTEETVEETPKKERN